MVSWDPEYLGPAALNRAWTLYNDERHADPKDVLRQATSGSGCNSCHTQGSCMKHCPVDLSPTGSIAGLKRSSLINLLKGADMEARLFALQRLTAMAMAPFVLVHLGLIIYAVRGGLSAGAVLSRTQGSWAWILFYGLFVACVAVHVPIGLRNILVEWLRLGRRASSCIGLAFGATILFLGLRAVAAVGGLLQ